MNNKYFYGSHLTERKFRQIIQLFCIDMEAKKVAEITGVSRQSINRIFHATRQRIIDMCEQNSPPIDGEFELDESYFGAHRVRGIRGRGAHGKVIVFGIMNRSGKVSAHVVEDCSANTLVPIIQRHIGINSVIYTDGFKTYNVLSKFGYKNVQVIHHCENEFAKNGGIHTNTIENFWGFCKGRLFKFRGMNREAFYMHIKECEFRYNNKNKNINKILTDSFKRNPLKLS